MRRSSGHDNSHGVRSDGFTLVELLVVIGIIALLLGILLPVFSKVQGRARDLKCQANLRQIGLALRGYAEENRGVFPYGKHYTRTIKPNGSGSSDWNESAGNNGDFISWASQLSKWMNKGKQAVAAEADPSNFSPILQCPEASQVRPHLISYAANMVVMPDPEIEFREANASPPAQIRPAKVSNLMPETALVWDTCVFASSQYAIDFLVGVDIDARRFWEGAAKPEYRYYLASDPFGLLPPPMNQFGQSKPIRMSVGLPVYKNIDPPESMQDSPYRGNLRFRHVGNSACNAVFADGHVGSFRAKLNSDKSVKSHDALRRYFMIKWLSGVAPSEDFAF